VVDDPPITILNISWLPVPVLLTEDTLPNCQIVELPAILTEPPFVAPVVCTSISYPEVGVVPKNTTDPELVVVPAACIIVVAGFCNLRKVLAPELEICRTPDGVPVPNPVNPLPLTNNALSRAGELTRNKL